MHVALRVSWACPRLRLIVSNKPRGIKYTRAGYTGYYHEKRYREGAIGMKDLQRGHNQEPRSPVINRPALNALVVKLAPVE
jgi:hypothetical protein